MEPIKACFCNHSSRSRCLKRKSNRFFRCQTQVGHFGSPLDDGYWNEWQITAHSVNTQFLFSHCKNTARASSPGRTAQICSWLVRILSWDELSPSGWVERAVCCWGGRRSGQPSFHTQVHSTSMVSRPLSSPPRQLGGRAPYAVHQPTNYTTTNIGHGVLCHNCSRVTHQTVSQT